MITTFLHVKPQPDPKNHDNPRKNHPPVPVHNPRTLPYVLVDIIDRTGIVENPADDIPFSLAEIIN
jgi:hypothetical protein